MAEGTRLAGSDRIRNRRCSVCGGTLTVHRVARGVCQDPNCQRTYAQGALREQRRRDAEEQKQKANRLRIAEQLREQATSDLDDDQRREVPLAVVPANTRSTVPLPAARPERFRQHLLEVLAEVFDTKQDTRDASPPAEPELNPAQLAVLGAACATCQGDCCLWGGDHAHLDVDSLRDYLAAHPQATPESVVNDYLKYVPAEAYQDSCLFHTQAGCALPREMRSREARRFFCEGLRTFRARLEQSGKGCGFVVAMDGDRVAATRLVMPPDRHGDVKCP